jgi:maltose phosphorylase
LHLTSIAAAWVNIVYGFGGLRSDGKDLVLKPKMPGSWQAFSFKCRYRGVEIEVKVTQTDISLLLDRDLDRPVIIGRKKQWLKKGLNQYRLDYRRLTDENTREERLFSE